MNTKKITALALAALMAAGSTSTVFAAVASADKDKVLEFVDSTGKTYYEENDDGLLVVDKDGVAPGESVYFRLQDNASVSGIEDKDRDRIKVYADWKMGKDYIKDIEVIYDKGNFQSTTNNQVIGFDYELAAGSSALNGVKVYVSGAKMDNATDPATITALKKAITNDQMKTAAGTDYEKKTGHVFGTKYYAAATVTSVLGTDLSWTVGTGSSNSNITEATPACGYGTFTGVASDLNSTAYFKEVNGVKYFIDTATVDTADKLVAALANAGVEAKKVDTDNTVYADNSDVVKNYDEVKELLLAEVTGYQNTPAQVLGAKDGFTYWVKIDTKESFTTKEQDIAGTLYLGTSKNSAEDKGSKLEIGLPLSNRIDDNNGSYVIKDGDTIYPDANGAVKFEDDAEEVTIYFGDNEEAWFTFNAKGQGALNLAYTTKFNKEIADLFPKANIDFISWIATPAANRTGDLYITANEDTFLYQVTDDGKGIKEVKGAKYLEDEGAWHLRTRELGSYVISDMELDTTAKVEDKDEASSNSSTSSKPNGDKHNPDTGR